MNQENKQELIFKKPLPKKQAKNSFKACHTQNHPLSNNKQIINKQLKNHPQQNLNSIYQKNICQNISIAQNYNNQIKEIEQPSTEYLEQLLKKLNSDFTNDFLKQQLDDLLQPHLKYVICFLYLAKKIYGFNQEITTLLKHDITIDYTIRAVKSLEIIDEQYSSESNSNDIVSQKVSFDSSKSTILKQEDQSYKSSDSEMKNQNQIKDDCSSEDNLKLQVLKLLQSHEFQKKCMKTVCDIWRDLTYCHAQEFCSDVLKDSYAKSIFQVGEKYIQFTYQFEFFKKSNKKLSNPKKSEVMKDSQEKMADEEEKVNNSDTENSNQNLLEEIYNQPSSDQQTGIALSDIHYPQQEAITQQAVPDQQVNHSYQQAALNQQVQDSYQQATTDSDLDESNPQ